MNGGRIIDTAANYDSQKLIGEWIFTNKVYDIKIITKIWKQEEFQRCLDELKTPKIYCCMVRENNYELVEFLKDQQENGLIEKFGISCYLPIELTRSYFQAIQIPCDLIVWGQKILLMSLYADVYIRSYYNHYRKNYENKHDTIIAELKENKKIKFVVGVDNLEQLKEDMELFNDN